MSTQTITSLQDVQRLTQDGNFRTPAQLLQTVQATDNSAVSATWTAGYSGGTAGILYSVQPTNPADSVFAVVSGFTDASGNAIGASFAVGGNPSASVPNLALAGGQAQDAPAEALTAVLGGWILIAATGNIGSFMFEKPVTPNQE